MKILLLSAGLCALPFFAFALTGCNKDSPVKQAEQAKMQSADQPQSLRAQNAKERKVRELLALTSGPDMGDRLIAMLVERFKRVPKLPAGYIAKFKELARPEELLDLVTEVHAKYVDEADLDAIIQFFRTEAGKRWIAAQPKIMRETQTIQAQWGQALNKKVLQALGQ